MILAKRILAVSALTVAVCSPGAALADYPADKPIRLVIGYSAGGAADQLARPIAEKVSKIIGQSIVMDYRPGAGGAIALEVVARTPPDGYTIHLTDSGPATILPNLRKTSYDPVKDFTPIAMVGSGGTVIVALPTSPAKDVQTFIELAKKDPAAWSYGTSGIGGVGHLLQFVQHKPRHDDEALDEFRLDQIGDATVNDDAGVQQQQPIRLVLRCEADVGDDERKVLLVAAHGQHNADVAKAQKQAQPDEPLRLAVGIFKQAGAVDEQRHNRAEQQAKGGRRKGAERKSLEHFVHGDEQAAEAEADHHAENIAMFFADKFGAHLADGVTADDAQAQK